MSYNSHADGVNLALLRFRQQNGFAYTEAEFQIAKTEAQFKVAEQGLVLRVTQTHFDLPIPQDSVQPATQYRWPLSRTAGHMMKTTCKFANVLIR